MSNLHIQINESIIDRYKSYGLSVDYLGSVLFILIGLYEEEYELLDSFDDGNKERRALILYQYLDRKGFLERDEDNDTIYSLTERGVEFVSFCKSQMPKGESKPIGPNHEVDQSQVTTKNLLSVAVQEETNSLNEDVSEWIQQWIDLFPEGKVEGRYLRTNRNECADRMRWFIKTYNFGKHTIFEATKFYLNSQESSSSGHTYTRNSSYFIFKGRSKQDRISDLATWCQRVKDEGVNNREGFQRDVV
jgi:hypothetical protein